MTIFDWIFETAKKVWRKISDWIVAGITAIVKGLWYVITGAISFFAGIAAIAGYLQLVDWFNSKKDRKHLSNCLISLINQYFYGGVQLSNVEIVENAIGVTRFKAMVHGHTIYWKGTFDEYNDLALLLHELHHVQQYVDYGHYYFYLLYAHQAMYYRDHDSMPIEISAENFSTAHFDEVDNEYKNTCLQDNDSASTKLKPYIQPDDWTMVIGLI